LRLKGAWGICSKRACIECRSHRRKDDVLCPSFVGFLSDSTYTF
jgi:hypothetical protein